MTMIYHHTPFSEDTPFNEDTFSNTFKANLEVLGPCGGGTGVGYIAEEGEVDQRK